MKTIYEEFVDRVQQGQRFRINLKTQTLSVGNTKLIKEGKFADDRIVLDICDNPFNEIENLYSNYISSIPGAKSDRCKTYFYAPSAAEMEIEDLIFGEERELARAKLEGYVLCLALSGFEWKDEMGSWFWKSPNFPQLVLLRKWFEKKGEIK